MKNHIIDTTITAESLTDMNAAAATLSTEVATFSVHLDEAQRKHSLKIGTRNETFARDMVEFARQYPHLVPSGINFSAIERDLIARDQVTPVLFQLKALVRALEDTHMALGIDLYNGTRGMYKAVKPIADINGVQDIIAQIGLRFARPRKSATPANSGNSGNSGADRSVSHSDEVKR